MTVREEQSLAESEIETQAIMASADKRSVA
jgi:hypothetical protein